MAQLVEQWSPKPRAEGSSPSAPAKRKSQEALFIKAFGDFFILKIVVIYTFLAFHLQLSNSYF